ncbi:MAG: sigma-70 family RNA polymerase sigma factor [Bacteroidales bacterium]|nr:sigma-70 family RNA polymerase sigma factor [Bacteroidales bacterium]
MQLFGKKKHLNTREKQGDPAFPPELLQKCKDGDRRAQKQLYDALSAKMFAVCLRYMGGREAAEDVFQEGFVTVFTKLDSYSGDGSFEGWARKIFVNTALMSLRKKDILRQTEEVDVVRSLAADSPTPIQNMSYRELNAMIAELPPGFRTVFNMYVIEGYSHKEIAEELGISETTSRSQLQRARTMLQNRIKQY